MPSPCLTALVVGYGSIGVRHARLLSELGCRTVVVSGRNIEFPVAYRGLETALATEQPEYVVIANPTKDHYDTLSTLGRLNYAGTVLVEKPIFDRYKVVPQHNFRKLLVAYNLRCHPVIQQLKALLINERVLSVQAYAGQYLPGWRPQSDYRASYSASAEQGGGVIRDLSHELDYLTWMLGGWKKVSAIGGHFSELEIDSDDIFSLMFTTPLCPAVTLQLNYLDRQTRRFVIINTAQHTIEADLVLGSITVDRDSKFFSTERDYTYREMHANILSENTESLCSMEEGLETLRLIEAAELAARQMEWVSR
jgi:predicted dehydrogenase